MLDITTQTGPRWLGNDETIHERINWLIAANRYEEHRRGLFRNGEDEEQLRLMRHPMSTERAYALFGLLLAGLPSAAIFSRFLDLPHPSRDFSDLFFFCLVMNVICMLAGRWTGARLGRKMDEVERTPRGRMMWLATYHGVCWAIATGAAGGAVFFGIGAFFGALVAIPVGLLGFLLFVPLHRLVAHGGMIDARHFWPLACGVVMFIAALILGR